MKINVFNDINSREKIKEENENKRNSKGVDKTPKKDKRGKTGGNKKEVPLLTNEIGIHDEVRDSDRVSASDEGL